MFEENRRGRVISARSDNIIHCCMPLGCAHLDTTKCTAVVINHQKIGGIGILPGVVGQYGGNPQAEWRVFIGRGKMDLMMGAEGQLQIVFFILGIGVGIVGGEGGNCSTPRE